MPIVAAILLRQIPYHVGIRRALLTIHFHMFSNATPDARVRGIAHRFATSLDKYITQSCSDRDFRHLSDAIVKKILNFGIDQHLYIFVYIYIYTSYSVFFTFKTYSHPRVGAAFYTRAFYSFTSCGFMPPHVHIMDHAIWQHLVRPGLCLCLCFESRQQYLGFT